MITGVNEGGTVGVAEDARVSDGCWVSVGAAVGVASATVVEVKVGAVVAVKIANGVRVALGVSVGGGSLVGSAASVGGTVRVGATVGVEKTNAVAVGRAGAGMSVRAVAQAMGVPSVGRGTVVGSSPSVLNVHPARVAATATATAAIAREYLKRFICALPTPALGPCMHCPARYCSPASRDAHLALA
jgi:UDP-3-O-[3-hydroxymyristoyl] glucosamine N-acyltransferase